MKSLVHTEEICSRSVPLEHAPGAKSLVCIGLNGCRVPGARVSRYFRVHITPYSSHPLSKSVVNSAGFNAILKSYPNYFHPYYFL